MVVEGEVGQHVPLGPGEELGAFASDGDEKRLPGIEGKRLAEEVRIESPAEPLVGAEEEDELFFSFAALKQGVGGGVDGVAKGDNDAVDKMPRVVVRLCS